jgi:3-oxocholest-4-en-26-oyl-CoA dehydrogenase beta subunit
VPLVPPARPVQSAAVDFGFTDVQQDLRGLARGILAHRVTVERLKELEAGADGMARDAWTAFADAQLLGVCLPEDVGGSGYGIMELCVLLAEVGRRTAPIPLLETLALGAMPIARFGTADQRAAVLPGVIDGSTVLTAALTDRPGSPGAVAKPDGDGWIVDAHRIAVPWATRADRVLVPTDDGVFVVDPGWTGVTIEPARSTHRQPQGSVVLDGVRVGPADILPAEAAHWMRRWGIAGLCATATGVLDEALRLTAGYLSQREQFGRPLATFQGAALRAADAYIDTEATTVATWSAVWQLAEGRDLPRADEALAVAKFWVAEGGQRVVAACQHLHGGIGVDIDYPVHRYFLWAKELELTMGGATSQLLDLGRSMCTSS